MKGLIGKKIGMTTVFNDGKSHGCTVIELGPCTVTQLKTKENDGYVATQLAFGESKAKNVSQQMKGHLAKAGIKPTAEGKLENARRVIEFRDFVGYQLGDKVTVDQLFVESDKVAVTGMSKGKGFQGVVKRHKFAGVGETTHGQHNRARHPGSIGSCSFPSKVFKGMRMAGRMGGEQVKIFNLKVIKIFAEQNILLIKGAVPGPIGSFVVVEKK